ncbi:universal stress protein [Arsenicitalea aurantiaca]|nr:universal stress protein [Arsenicitalea aurantiaca]
MPKDIVVRLDGSQDDETLLAHAEPIASQFGASILALQVNILPELQGMGYPVSAGLVQDIVEEARAEARTLRDTLKRRLDRLSVPAEHRLIELYSPAAGRVVSSEARAADLYIAPIHHPDAPDAAELAETVLFNAGRACLFVPRTTPQGQYRTILVGWNDSRESTRALAEAMPFLTRAENVVLCTASEHSSEAERREPAADIARHLARYGVNVEVRNLDGWADAGAALLNEAGRSGAQLIVSGAYGHSRFRQWVLGGVTRTLLNEAPVPVLVAH